MFDPKALLDQVLGGVSPDGQRTMTPFLGACVHFSEADLDEAAATRARAQITSALRLFGLHGRPGQEAHNDNVWHPQVLQLSALKGTGLPEFWDVVKRYQALQQRNGQWQQRRLDQDQAWMWERIESGLRQQFHTQPKVRAALVEITQQVALGQVPASTAARQLLALAQAN